MRSNWLMGVMILWFILTIVSLILDVQYVGVEQTSALNTLLHPGFIEGASIPFVGFFIVTWEYISTFIGMLFFNYSFLTGSWEILKIFGWILSVATIIGLVISLRGN